MLGLGWRALVLRGARSGWRGLCELQAVAACAKSGRSSWRRCGGWLGRSWRPRARCLGGGEQGGRGGGRRDWMRRLAGMWVYLRACGSNEAPRPNALADKEAARIERGAWAALRCGDASAARGRAADTPGEKRAPHHSEHHWEQQSPLLGCDSLLERAVARRRAGALTRGRGGAKGRRGAAAAAAERCLLCCASQDSKRPPSRSVSYICKRRNCRS